jgi:predicted site-specific integrase-resolvase
MTKKQAAQTLGIGVRTLERYVADGRIKQELIKGKMAYQAYYNPMEVERFKKVLEAEKRDRLEIQKNGTSLTISNQSVNEQSLAKQEPVPQIVDVDLREAIKEQARQLIANDGAIKNAIRDRLLYYINT